MRGAGEVTDLSYAQSITAPLGIHPGQVLEGTG